MLREEQGGAEGVRGVWAQRAGSVGTGSPSYSHQVGKAEMGSLSQASYRNQTLIFNNLVASLLWHNLAVLNPPYGLSEKLQRKLMNFFLSGHHWLRAAVPYLLYLCKQGLVDLQNRVAVFRLQVGQRLQIFAGETQHKLCSKDCSKWHWT